MNGADATGAAVSGGGFACGDLIVHVALESGHRLVLWSTRRPGFGQIDGSPPGLYP